MLTKGQRYILAGWKHVLYSAFFALIFAVLAFLMGTTYEAAIFGCGAGIIGTITFNDAKNHRFRSKQMKSLEELAGDSIHDDEKVDNEDG